MTKLVKLQRFIVKNITQRLALLQARPAGAHIYSLLLQQKYPFTHMDHLLHRTANESTYYAPPPREWLLGTTTISYYSGQLFSSPTASGTTLF